MTVNPPAAGKVVVTGKIEFERIPFRTSPATGLDPANPLPQPAREVVVEVLDSTNSTLLLGSTTTNAQGVYAAVVDANRTAIVRAKAQTLRTGSAPTWNFRVLNNTNGNALYAMDGTAFGTGTDPITGNHNLLAPTGWDGASYSSPRVAAPFAVLDTAYAARELILSAVPGTQFPSLNLYWSATNRATAGALCTTSGAIGTTFFTSGSADAANCTSNGPLAAGIYILGDFAGGNGDTDEFDQHVIAHEFGHYVENGFSRSDSTGGGHSPGDRLDLRLAFGEGWGNAYSAMTLNDPAYRDSFRGFGLESSFNLESDSATAEGWFSEFSVGEILWDLFDSVADGADQIALGFPPIYAVMTGAQKNSEALTSIFSFAAALRSENPGQASAINALLTGEGISNSNAFGDNESNAGGSSTALPIYRDISVGQPLSVCGSGADDDRNKLGYRRLLRLSLTSSAVLTISATGAVDANTPSSIAATDPDIFVYRSGTLVQFSQEVGQTETISQKPFGAGLHIIEVFDFDFTTLNASVPHCMTVSISGG